jgi:hypothetical protein
METRRLAAVGTVEQRRASLPFSACSEQQAAKQQSSEQQSSEQQSSKQQRCAINNER